MSYTYDYFENVCNLLKNKGFHPKKYLDIGASLCQTSIIVKKIWPEIDILVIEADESFEEYYISNKFNYQIKCLGKYNGTTKFYKTKLIEGNSGNSIYRENTEIYNDDNVIIENKNIYKLDDVLNDTFDFIKIDTQGSELDIIIGGEKIMRNAKVIITEISFIDYNINGNSSKDLIQYLEKLGYDYIFPIENIKIYDKIIQQSILFIKK